MPPVVGIFVISELHGAAAERVRGIQLRYDPKLAAQNPPHVTLVGSSGVGPIPANTPIAELRDALEPIARDTPPFSLELGAPHRFMQTDIVVLPLDPHGALRKLHDRIATCGLRFARPRFTFSPHVTLTFYKTLTPVEREELLAIRVDEPAVLMEIVVSLTHDPLPSRTLLRLPFGG